MDARDRAAPLAKLGHRLGDRAVGGTPANHQRLSLGVPVDFQRWIVLADPSHFFSPNPHHLFVVRRIVRNRSGEEILLQPADAMFQSRGAWFHPSASQGDGVAVVDEEITRIGTEVYLDRLERLHVWDAPLLPPLAHVTAPQ